MEPSNQTPKPQDLPPKAQRAIRIIQIAMGILIILPALLAWLTGAIDF